MKSIIHPALLLAAVSLGFPAFAQAPALVPVQGFLTDDDGAPVDGATTIELAIYDARTSANSLYSESQVVDVEAGYFTIELGLTDELDLALFRDHGELWLEMTVDSERLTPRIQLATTPFAAFAEYAGDAATLSGATLAEVTAAPSWDDIEGIPGDIADGDDVGEVDLSGYQQRVGGTCSEGSAIRTIAPDGGVTCEPDDDTDTTYSNGFGLVMSGGTGTVFNVDPNVVQARVAGTCAAGSSIRAVASNGTVTCEHDDDTNTTYSAGSGLSLLGTVFSIAPDGVTATSIADNAVGPDAVNLPYGHQVMTGTVDLDWDDNYLLASLTYTPSSAGTCMVTSTIMWDSQPGDTAAPYARTARQAGVGEPANDATRGPYLPAVGSAHSAPGTVTYPWPVSAGESNRFGCMLFGIGDSVGRPWTCRVTWFCF